ncbi:MAG: hypothetical protein ACP5H6_09045, partial [Caldivirga sp.]
KFRDVFRSMVEVFVDKEWGFLSVNGRTVIDVSAFVGDSSIYFALRGAKEMATTRHASRFSNQTLLHISLSLLTIISL